MASALSIIRGTEQEAVALEQQYPVFAKIQKSARDSQRDFCHLFCLQNLTAARPRAIHGGKGQKRCLIYDFRKPPTPPHSKVVTSR